MSYPMHNIHADHGGGMPLGVTMGGTMHQPPKRGRAYRRHHRVRICRKRFLIKRDALREGQSYSGSGPHAFAWEATPVDVASQACKLSKQNLACSCGMCKPHKYVRQNKADRMRARMEFQQALKHQEFD